MIVKSKTLVDFHLNKGNFQRAPLKFQQAPVNFQRAQVKFQRAQVNFQRAQVDFLLHHHQIKIG